MPVYILIVIWILAMVPAVVGHRRAHRADALVSFAAFQARGRMLSEASPSPTRAVSVRRRRVAGFLVVALLAGLTVALVLRERWTIAVVAGLLHLTVFWYAAVVRNRLRLRRA